LACYIVDLYFKATDQTFPDKQLQKVENGKPFKFNYSGTRIRFERNTWANTLHSYDLTFTLRRNDTKGY
jgi:hypothetical protein